MYQSYISEVSMQRCLNIHQTRERFRYVIFVDKKVQMVEFLSIKSHLILRRNATEFLRQSIRIR